MATIGWRIDIGIDGEAPMVLSRNTAIEQIQEACNLCINGLCSHYNLSHAVNDGIQDRFSGLRAKLVSGSEASGEYGVLPLGEIVAPVFDLRNGRRVERQHISPEVRVSIEGISQEATNLLAVMRLFADPDEAVGLNEGTIDRINQFLDERDLLTAAAMRVAAARRILKYVILPDSLLSDSQRATVGYDRWLKDQMERLNLKKLSPQQRKVVKKGFVDNNVAAKNLRRTVWAPLFFSNLGIDPNEIVFYLKYHDIVAGNCDETVTFNSRASVILSAEEAETVFANIFEPSEPNLKLV